MATKIVSFKSLAAGDRFQFDGESASRVKVSSRRHEAISGGDRCAVAPSTLVVVTYDDRTPEQIATDEREHRRAYGLRRVARAVEEVERRTAEKMAAFIEKLAVNPFYALEWSTDLYDVAATAKVHAFVKAALADGVALDEVVASCRAEALRGARFPSRSTSPAANLAAQSLVAAYAAFVADAEAWL